MTDPALWARLAAYDFAMTKPAVDLPNSVVRDTTLNTAQAQAAVDEYRRFVYLTAVHGPTQPSHVLQAIWRVHAADTYASAQMWRDVIGCGMVPFDATHKRRASDPVDAATLALFQAEFGHAPHSKIWPDARLRRWVQAMVWAVAAGFVLAVVGITQSSNAMIAIGTLVALSGFLWSITYAPWAVSNRPDGSGDGVMLTGDGSGRGDGGKADADSTGSDGAGGGDGGGGGGD